MNRPAAEAHVPGQFPGLDDCAQHLALRRAKLVFRQMPVPVEPDVVEGCPEGSVVEQPEYALDMVRVHMGHNEQLKTALLPRKLLYAPGNAVI